MDKALEMGGEEMAKSQGHGTTAFNIGGVCLGFLLLFHGFDLCFCFVCLFEY